MKRWVFSFIFLLISNIIYGQAALLILIFGDKIASEKFHLSLDVGVNTPLIYDMPDPVFPGIHFGLGTHLKIKEPWFLVAEFTPLNGFQVKNAPRITPLPSSVSPGFDPSKNRWKGNILQVPIFVEYHIDRRWSVGTGPLFSFLTQMDQFYEDEVPGLSQKLELKDDLRSQFRDVYYNWMADVNFTLYKDDKQAAIIRLRYIQGLTRVFEQDVQTVEGDPRTLQSKWGNIQLILTVPFIE